MRMAARGLVVIASLCAATLAGCQSYIPRAEDPIRPVPLAASMPPTSSSQRLDEDGYPMIGAYPTAAGAQLTDDEVRSNRAGLAQSAAGRGAPVDTSGYRRSVAEMKALAAQQRKVASTELTPNTDISGLRAAAAAAAASAK